jgi:hypothetical protein
MKFLSIATTWVATYIVTITALPALPPKDTLQWSTCDYDFDSKGPVECATLQVPLDYTNETSVLRVSATKAPSMGSILFNPGGPGGLGTQHVAEQQANINRYENMSRRESGGNLTDSRTTEHLKATTILSGLIPVGPDGPCHLLATQPP